MKFPSFRTKKKIIFRHGNYKSRLSKYSCQKISHSVEHFCEQQKTSSFIGTVFKSTVNRTYITEIFKGLEQKSYEHSLHISSTKRKHDKVNVISPVKPQKERAFLININYHKIKTKNKVVTWLAKNLKHTQKKKKKSRDDNSTIELM